MYMKVWQVWTKEMIHSLPAESFEPGRRCPGCKPHPQHAAHRAVLESRSAGSVGLTWWGMMCHSHILASWIQVQGIRNGMNIKKSSQAYLSQYSYINFEWDSYIMHFYRAVWYRFITYRTSQGYSNIVLKCLSYEMFSLSLAQCVSGPICLVQSHPLIDNNRHTSRFFKNWLCLFVNSLSYQWVRAVLWYSFKSYQFILNSLHNHFFYHRCMNYFISKAVLKIKFRKIYTLQ